MGGDRKTLRVQMGADPADMRTATLSVSTPEQKTFDRGEPLATRREFCLGLCRFTSSNLWYLS